MILSYKTQNIDFSEDINDLLCIIDLKLSKLSEQKLNSERYGEDCKIDYNKFFILSTYRKILDNKGKNSCCLKNFLIDDIIDAIKQYLSSGKVYKINKIIK